MSSSLITGSDIRGSLIVFDFDGTITCKDSFLEFLRFALGLRKLVCGFIYLSPILSLVKNIIAIDDFLY